MAISDANSYSRGLIADMASKGPDADNLTEILGHGIEMVFRKVGWKAVDINVRRALVFQVEVGSKRVIQIRS